MPPANATNLIEHSNIEPAAHAIGELIAEHREWFISEDGRPPFEVNSDDLDFSAMHQRLIFSYWNQTGVRPWRVRSWNWSGEKLLLQASRRMGAETMAIELVPRASAKALVASIAAARQARCEKLAKSVSEFISNSKIEKAVLSPGMRRD